MQFCKIWSRVSLELEQRRLLNETYGEKMVNKVLRAHRRWKIGTNNARGHGVGGAAWGAAGERVPGRDRGDLACRWPIAIDSLANCNRFCVEYDPTDRSPPIAI